MWSLKTVVSWSLSMFALSLLSWAPLYAQTTTADSTEDSPANVDETQKNDAPADIAKPPKKSPEDESVIIKADEITNTGATGVSVAVGNVTIKYKNKIISGNRATFDQNTGDGVVEGDVWYTDGKAEIYCDKLGFNSNSEMGEFFNGKGDFNKEFYFTGEKIVRLHEMQYTISNGAITSCSGEEPEWELDSSDIDLTVEGYAYMTNSVLRAGGVPVLYSPYWAAPVKRKRATGFLSPSIGFSDRNGFLAENSFFWAISDNADATLTHKFMGKRGNLYGGEFRYIFAKGTSGNFYGETIQEDDKQTGQSRDLWKIRYDHAHALPYKVKGIVHLDIESDDSINREFSNNVINRTRRYTDSYATLTKTWTNKTLSFVGRENRSILPNREDTVSTLPMITFTNQEEQLWDTPFYGGFETSATSFRTESTAGTRSSQFDVDRFDIFPSVSLPVSPAPWLTVTPEVGFQVTNYSNGIDEKGNETNESFTRELLVSSVEIKGPKFYRIFETSSEKRPKIKHLFTPSLKWSYVPGYGFDGEDRMKVKKIDSRDNSRPVNLIRVELLNQALTKEIVDEKTSKTVEAVSFRVSQSFDFNEADRTTNLERRARQPFTPLDLDLDTHIFPWLLLNYRTTYNYYDEVWNSSDLELGFEYDEIFALSLDRIFKWGGNGKNAKNSTWDTVYTQIKGPYGLSLDYSLIYDEEKSETNNTVLNLTYSGCCWSTTVSWFKRKLNISASSSQLAVEEETGWLLTISLKGVGDVFGKRRAPVAARRNLNQ